MTIEAAASSATEIFRDPDQPTPYEPQSLDEGKAAVEAFASAYERADKTLRRAAERSRSGASSLSDDPLQGLSEVIQNADDQGASYVRIVYTTSSITFFHDGDAAHLKNIHAISLPWLTTNEENSETTGRFGIGLSTLQTLSDHFDFFSGTYRVRVGSPFLTWLDGDPPASADPSDVTVLRVPLDKSEIDAAQFMRWVEVWDHQGLIFLKSVRSVIFQGESLDTTLRLESHLANSGSGGDAVRVRRVEDPDGRSWRVFSQDFDTPPGLTRKAKKTASTATIDIAFPMADVPSTGQLYAGLAVESFPIPVLINAPFDPTTSRRGFLSNEWNGAISSLVLETWESAVVDLFLTDPEHAWAHVPVKAGSGLGLSQSANQLASNLYERATRLAERVQLRIDEVNVELSQTAAEVPALNGVMDSAAMERLLGVTWVPSDQRDDSGIWLSVWNHWLAEGQPIHPLVEPSDAAPLLESPDRSDEWVIRLHSIVIEDDSDDLAVGKPCIVTSSGRFPMPDQDAIVAFSREESTGLGRSLGVTTTLSEIYETAPGGSVVLGHLTDQKRLLDEHSPEALLLHLARIGGSGDVEPIPVTDDQLIEIRIAVETLGRMFFNEIGEGLGKAIAVDCVHSVGETRETKRVRPADAYLGRPYMTEARSWAAAATTRVGWWVHPRYDS
ncbi:MAG TPA: hypothetical protein VL068_15120, partial [Microthrixaceae bacterium]|nr:hypothetical protein [Microthrixaceae bacterium]